MKKLKLALLFVACSSVGFVSAELVTPAGTVTAAKFDNLFGRFVNNKEDSKNDARVLFSYFQKVQNERSIPSGSKRIARNYMNMLANDNELVKELMGADFEVPVAPVRKKQGSSVSVGVQTGPVAPKGLAGLDDWNDAWGKKPESFTELVIVAKNIPDSDEAETAIGNALNALSEEQKRQISKDDMDILKESFDF